MEQNLKLGLTHEDIIKQLGISKNTTLEKMQEDLITKDGI